MHHLDAQEAVDMNCDRSTPDVKNIPKSRDEPALKAKKNDEEK